MKNRGTVATSVVSAVALVSLGATPLTALAVQDTPDGQAAQNETCLVTESASSDKAVAPTHVEGTFTFNQNEITSNQDIVSVFAKAAATLCQATPDYYAQEVAKKITICAHGAPVLESTVHELTEGNENDGFILACACASNAPGGGAAVNAEVQGVPLAAIAAAVNG